MSKPTSPDGWRPYLHRFLHQLAVGVVGIILLPTLGPSHTMVLDSTLEVFPFRPFSFDISFNQRTFASHARVIAVQADISALWYSLMEVRTVSQFYSQHTKTFTTDQHSLYVNRR